MGVSSYTFACATDAQKREDWIESMVRALVFYGGVPALIVPDNPRALISVPDRYEPRAHDTVLDFARHFGTSVLPARPYAARDKATAEIAVQVVTRWILARLRHRAFHHRERGRSRHRRAAAVAEQPAVSEAARLARERVRRG
jgi:transposase